MWLFFTGAQLVFWGWKLKTLEEGHRVLMEQAFAKAPLPPQIDPETVILGNHRADIPHLRPDGTVGLWGIFVALLIAQTMPKYAHGMRQPWHHPTRNLAKVQQTLYQGLLRSATESHPQLAAEALGRALHTLQDTYTLGHTERQNNADPFSPLLRLHYSPSSAHPFISPRDRVWTDKNTLTPEANAAIFATVEALKLWSGLWCSSPEQAAAPLQEFVQRYVPVK